MTDLSIYIWQTTYSQNTHIYIRIQVYIAYFALLHLLWTDPNGVDIAFFQEGERGYLEGLASRYADLFRTHYGDVLEPLEELRRRETNASRMPNTQLTTSHSQPIYVPGKYSVSILPHIRFYLPPFPFRQFFFYYFRG